MGARLRHGDALVPLFTVFSLLAILSLGTEIAATLSAIASMLRDIRLEVRAVPAAMHGEVHGEGAGTPPQSETGGATAHA